MSAQTITGYDAQAKADALIDAALEGELAQAMRRKLNRLARAQSLAWQALSVDEQRAYLRAVDALEAKS